MNGDSYLTGQLHELLHEDREQKAVAFDRLEDFPISWRSIFPQDFAHSFGIVFTYRSTYRLNIHTEIIQFLNIVVIGSLNCCGTALTCSFPFR